MPFFEEFLKCLVWRPVQAIEALYWWMTRRRVRARNCLRRDIYKAPYAYRIWQETVESKEEESIVTAFRHGGWTYRPPITVLAMEADGIPPAIIASSLRSVLRQSYDDFEMILPTSFGSLDLTEDAKARITLVSNDPVADISSPYLVNALSCAQGDYVLFLKAGDRLSPNAFLFFVKALQQHLRPAVLFANQDELHANGSRRNPWFKPQWNREIFLTQDYLTDSCLIDAGLARAAAAYDPFWPSSTPYSLTLAATSVTVRPIVHIPHIGCHTRRRIADHDAKTRRETVVMPFDMHREDRDGAVRFFLG